jgi:hypothetical protein
MKNKHSYSIATVLLICLLTGCSCKLNDTDSSGVLKDLCLTGIENVQLSLTVINHELSDISGCKL